MSWNRAKVLHDERAALDDSVEVHTDTSLVAFVCSLDRDTHTTPAAIGGAWLTLAVSGAMRLLVGSVLVSCTTSATDPPPVQSFLVNGMSLVLTEGDSPLPGLDIDGTVEQALVRRAAGSARRSTALTHGSASSGPCVEAPLQLHPSSGNRPSSHARFW